MGSKLIIKIASCLLFLVFSFLFSVRGVTAQVPPPPVACNEAPEPNPEFHLLRPYQKSATCTSVVSDYASFCGNNLTLTDTITKTYSDGSNCQSSGGKTTCTYAIHVDKPVTINLTGANLPIMGNTEDVKNSQNATDSLNDAQKTNEYVSWYLNGVNGSVDFAGPINKLLPQDIQNQARIKSVKDSGSERHNQIVVCTDSGNPTDCYNGDGSPAQGKIYRLKSWNTKRLLAKAYNLLIKAYSNLFPENITQIVQDSVGNAWPSNLPPIMGDPQFNGNNKLYLKAYNEWKGKSCILIPVINALFCIDNPLIPNDLADLFSYVPLASTEDIKGNITVDKNAAPQKSGSGLTVTNAQFSNQTPSTLFFPHLIESDQLGSLLQDTYAQKGADKTGAPTEVDSKTCNALEVRSNKGDSLFASQISGNLIYDATFSCDFKSKEQLIQENKCTTSIFGLVFCPIQSCSKEISVNLSTQSNTPKIDDIWSRLVAGPASVFKRIFPKTNTIGSVGQIIDIPGSTKVDYSGAQANSASLNFPHIGGISEYFLKGIQTMLRPKGYGEPITFKPNTVADASGDICGVGSKYKIPCCMLKGIVEVETANNPLFIGKGTCDRNGKTFACCNGNYCGPANIACNQYTAWNGNDNLDLCDPTDSAELLARAMLFKLCQADGKCVSGWAKDGNYILANYSIKDGDYTAAAYFYGLNNGCGTTSCSQFRWGEGKGYCNSVKSYCDTGKALESKPDVRYCKQCNIDEMIPAGVPIDCSAYQ